MINERELVAFLKNDEQCSSVFKDRFFVGYAPANTSRSERPFIIVTLIDGSSIGRSLSGSSFSSSLFFQIDCYLPPVSSLSVSGIENLVSLTLERFYAAANMTGMTLRTYRETTQFSTSIWNLVSFDFLITTRG